MLLTKDLYHVQDIEHEVHMIYHIHHNQLFISFVYKELCTIKILDYRIIVFHDPLFLLRIILQVHF